MTTENIIQTSRLLAPATAFFVGGYGFAASQNAVAQLYDLPPAISTPLFAKIFNSGAPLAISLSIISAVFSSFLAYTSPSPAHQKLYVFSAVAMLSALPYTRLLMIPGIKRLFEISESKELQEKPEQSLECRKLMKSWVRLNYIRSGFFLSGGVAALYAALFG